MYTFESMISELLENNQNAINAYFSCYQNPLGKSIKIIKKKIDIDTFLVLGRQYGWILEKQKLTSDNDVYYIQRENDSIGLGKHWLHNAGFFYIQEIAASLPVQFLPIKDGDFVLDMCSAPGGKAVQINDKGGYVVSNEVNKSRIVPLLYNLNRIGVYNSTVTSISGEKWGALMPNSFDHVLVDAPCSGEGTGFKSDDGIKYWREENIQKIARLQKDILISAINACKPGGTIIYSTCTINPWENEGVVTYALQTFGDNIVLENIHIPEKTNGITHWNNEELLSVEDSLKVCRFLPHQQHTGGFFIAKFTKNGEYELQNQKSDNMLVSQLDISNSLQKKISDILFHDYGIIIDQSKYLFISSQKQVYLTSPIYMKIHGKVHTEKTGVPIFKRDKKDLIPLHGLGNCLGHLANKNTLHLPEEVLQKYSEGGDIQVDSEWGIINNDNKYTILKYKDYGISVGKVVDGYIKNKFIK